VALIQLMLRRAQGRDPVLGVHLADFLRCGVKCQLVERDFDAAVAEAIGLMRSREAAYLPGWCRPDQGPG
jgi:hypothetical protein